MKQLFSIITPSAFVGYNGLIFQNETTPVAITLTWLEGFKLGIAKRQKPICAFI
jgi:hypothetical protein